ncbi:MAG TPA: pseudouridine-5'-phosphate glycosidase [Gemmatimonadaceae bacterium]|nr:pseudouridine-5'-phosphate glycosidase [Gemmatimonadaceae bacterium]
MRPDTTLDFSASVRQALDRQAPIVALESSVLAQGLPIPANAEAARRMVDAVVRQGAVPAIAAISRGRPTIGLDGDDLQRFLRREGVRKVSSRDLGAAMAQGADGATTVAATLVLARLAKIQIFATGGIGGVHRRSRREQAQNAQVRDESADLIELARSRLIVVCAGAKSILDLAATWERLETLSIPVIGYRTSELPGFFTAETGIHLSVRCDTAIEIARIACNHWSLGNRESVLVVQAPPPTSAVPRTDLEGAIAEALIDAEQKKIEGPAMTPFLLEAVSRLTNRRSLDVNLALLENNAALAGDIACALAVQ